MKSVIQKDNFFKQRFRQQFIDDILEYCASDDNNWLEGFSFHRNYCINFYSDKVGLSKNLLNVIALIDNLMIPFKIAQQEPVII